MKKDRKYNTKPNSTSFKKGHKKIGGVSKGDKMSESSKEKMRKNLLGKTGSLSRNWKGGISQERSITCPRSLEWRMEIFKRDNWTCQSCGIRGVRLEAHHIKSWAEYIDLRFDIENGVSLCCDCHKLTDNYKGKGNKRK